MTDQEIADQLAELYPNSGPKELLTELAAVVNQFDLTEHMHVTPLMQTLVQWRFVLKKLGPEGLTLEGMLSYEFDGLPGVQLCRRVDRPIKYDGDMPFLPSQYPSEEPDITGFVPIQAPDCIAWLREQGSYAIIDGVPLKVD
jgi:hypothetical protein